MKTRKLNNVLYKYFFAVLMLVIFNTQVFSKKIGDLDGILKPFILKAARDRIFISDQYSVSSYSINNLKFFKKIGEKGEGPGQFMEEPFIKIFDNKIMLHTLGRSIFFSLNGKLLKQLKNKGIFYDITCVDKNYVVFQMKMPRRKEKYYYFDLIIKDSNFNDIKIIGSEKSPKQQPKKKKKIFLVEPVFKFQAFDSKIYTVSNKEGEFLIDIYGHNGILLRKIKRKYNRIRISEEYKKKKIDEKRNNPNLKKMWNIIIKRTEFCFPKYFPAMKDFRVRDGKIYVKTYKPGKGGVEFLVLDLHGKLLSTSFLPDIKIEYWDIRNNYFYYLNSNEDLETWELHSIKIQD